MRGTCKSGLSRPPSTHPRPVRQLPSPQRARLFTLPSGRLDSRPRRDGHPVSLPRTSRRQSRRRSAPGFSNMATIQKTCRSSVFAPKAEVKTLGRTLTRAWGEKTEQDNKRVVRGEEGLLARAASWISETCCRRIKRVQKQHDDEVEDATEAWAKPEPNQSRGTTYESDVCE